ncbi:MAG: type I restriction-modification system subunit M [Fusobacteriaceae bacterium]
MVIKKLQPPKKLKQQQYSDKKLLWDSCDKLRNNMDPAEYKYIVLGLVFLKYISDKFEEKYDELKNDGENFEEDKDAYLADNIFWVPAEARWKIIQSKAKTSEIGKTIDDAMVQIEKENDALKNVLYKVFSNPNLDKGKLGELIDIIAKINMGNKNDGSPDVLGQVYEFFLGKFANSEGKNGGQFYTPESIVKTIVNCLEPTKGRVYDPACGSGGMFVQSEKFVANHSGNKTDISIYGQESNGTTWKLCKMNLAIRGIEVNLGKEPADSFTNDQHKYEQMDFVMANPPFNVKDYWHKSLEGDSRWKFGTPPEGNANYAWLQHMIAHLAPNGRAGIVLANGSLSSNTGTEGDIRQKMLEENIVDAIVALPEKLFLTTGIPACIWFLDRSKTSKDVLFIDARTCGRMIDRKTRELTDEDIQKISDTYHSWKKNKNYSDEKGFCKSASLDDIKSHKYVLTPGRYVGTSDELDDGIPYEDKMNDLTLELAEQFSKSKNIENEIKKNLKSIGFDI